MKNNVIVLDLEVLNSPDWCKHCLQIPESHGHRNTPCKETFEKIGWRDYRLLGISIGCYYDYADDRYHYFDRRTLEATIHTFTKRQALMASFNGKQFDFPLMAEVFEHWVDHLSTADSGEALHKVSCYQLKHDFLRLAENSYDILDEIWKIDPANKFQKGNSLGAIAPLNGYGEKEMHGAHAPDVWRQGRYAEVVEYCTGDVWKTKKLFEQVCRGEAIKRPAGAVLLPIPN